MRQARVRKTRSENSHSAREMESARALDACLYALPRRRHPVRERHALRRLGGRPIASAHRDRGCTDPTRLRSDRADTVKKVDGAEINKINNTAGGPGTGRPRILGNFGRGRIFKIEKKRA